MRRTRGATLIELGLVLGVIAVLAAVVLVGRGFFRASKQSAMVQLVQSVRVSAKQYAERKNNGLSYAGATVATLPGLPSPLDTPFGGAVTVAAVSAPAGSCDGDACVKICGPVEDATLCADLRTQVPRTVQTDCDTTCSGKVCFCAVVR